MDSITGSCILSVAAAQHLTPEMSQQNSQSPQQQGFTVCTKTQALGVISQTPRAFQTLLWMAADVSWVWHHSWQPLVPEIAPNLGGRCVMSQATF